MTSESDLNIRINKIALCFFQYPVCAVYRVRPTVTGPSGEDAGLHHHAWQSGTGTSPGPVATTRRPQGSAAWSAEHSSHHHDDDEHRDEDADHHETHTQHFQEGRAGEFGVC